MKLGLPKEGIRTKQRYLKKVEENVEEVRSEEKGQNPEYLWRRYGPAETGETTETEK